LQWLRGRRGRSNGFSAPQATVIDTPRTLPPDASSDAHALHDTIFFPSHEGAWPTAPPASSSAHATTATIERMSHGGSFSHWKARATRGEVTSGLCGVQVVVCMSA
jgi:hypothetical protein